MIINCSTWSKILKTMALTKNELRLLRSVTLAVFRTLWEKQALLKEDVISLTRYLEAVYISSPQLLVDKINTYSADLTNEEMNSAYEKISEIFKEIRENELNV